MPNEFTSVPNARMSMLHPCNTSITMTFPFLLEDMLAGILNTIMLNTAPVLQKKKSSSGLPTGAVIGALFVGDVAIFLLVKFVLGYRSGIDSNFKQKDGVEASENESSTIEATGA